MTIIFKKDANDAVGQQISNFYAFKLPTPGPEVIKLFLCSTQLSTKFQLLVKTEIQANKYFPCLKSLICCIYHAYKY